MTEEQKKTRPNPEKGKTLIEGAFAKKKCSESNKNKKKK